MNNTWSTVSGSGGISKEFYKEEFSKFKVKSKFFQGMGMGWGSKVKIWSGGWVYTGPATKDTIHNGILLKDSIQQLKWKLPYIQSQIQLNMYSLFQENPNAKNVQYMYCKNNQLYGG